MRLCDRNLLWRKYKLVRDMGLGPLLYYSGCEVAPGCTGEAGGPGTQRHRVGPFAVAGWNSFVRNSWGGKSLCSWMNYRAAEPSRIPGKTCGFCSTVLGHCLCCAPLGRWSEGNNLLDQCSLQWKKGQCKGILNAELSAGGKRKRRAAPHPCKLVLVSFVFWVEIFCYVNASPIRTPSEIPKLESRWTVVRTRLKPWPCVTPVQRAASWYMLVFK